MSADDALRLVSDASGPILARKAICSRAHVGLVHSRARRLVVGDEQRDRCDVPQKFWWAEGEAALTQNWATGDFETWIDHRVHCLAYGVEFLRADIEEMVPGKARGRAFKDSPPGNYEPAARCLDELKSSLGITTAEASAAILKHCRAGLIPSRCKEVWWRLRNRYGDQEPEIEQNVEVPEWAWASVSTADAVLNWLTSTFAGTDTIDGDELKVRLTGVEFDVSAIVDLERHIRSLKEDTATRTAPEPEPEPESSQSAGRGGRRPSKSWPNWVAELVAVIHNEGIPDGQGAQGQEELLNKVADALAERGIEGLGRTTVQPVVQAVLDRLRAGN